MKGKRWLSVFLLACLVIGLFPAAANAEEGTGSLSWVMDGAGTLTISGTGEMENYSYDKLSPWHNDESIQMVQIESGVTSIGDSAFWGCGLSYLALPESVASIGEGAFLVCTGLSDVYCWGGGLEGIAVGENNSALTAASVHSPGAAALTVAAKAGAAAVASDRPFGDLAGNVRVLEGSAALSGAELDPDDATGRTALLSFTGTSGPVTVEFAAGAFAGPAGFTSASQVRVDAAQGGETAAPSQPAAPETPEAPASSGFDWQAIVRDEPAVEWIDRLNLPDYALELYSTLGSSSFEVLIEDESSTLPASDATPEIAEVEEVQALTSEMDRPFAGNAFSEGVFAQDSLNAVDPAAGDRAVDYPNLKEGDVVRTSAFNGIYVTKVTKSGNTSYDADVKNACAYVTTAYQAFDRDHPEVFWLSGKSKIRLVTASVQKDTLPVKETFVFFTLADAEGFTVRDASASQSGIQAQIAQRDAAVETILSTVTGSTPAEKVADLNRWLTEHNEYNTTADLNTISNAPHECLSALTGSIGGDGPVCDGYSRAFKVLCGKLDIPCVLVDGFAQYDMSQAGVFHMWNSVQMADGGWYGVDVTWDDPVVEGVSGARSGHEHERYMLVGSDTEISGLQFSASHPPLNRAAEGGAAFSNGPALSAAAFNPMAAIPGLPFMDVGAGNWYEDAVRYVHENGLMNGVTETAFAPDGTVTRAMIWTILARLDGQTLEQGNPWYAPAQSWAAESGISDGSDPNGAITREQLATILWRYAGSPAAEGSLENFSDGDTVSGYAAEAVCWAVDTGLLTGMTDGTVQPRGEASRAQAAAILMRFCEN